MLRPVVCFLHRLSFLQNLHCEWSCTVTISLFTQPSDDSVWKQYVKVTLQLLLLLLLLPWKLTVAVVVVVGTCGGAVGWDTGATSQKVTGSIPDGVIGIFHWHKPSGRYIALGSIQPVTDISTRNISWAENLTIFKYRLSCHLETWEPQSPGTRRDCPGPNSST